MFSSELKKAFDKFDSERLSFLTDEMRNYQVSFRALHIVFLFK